MEFKRSSHSPLTRTLRVRVTQEQFEAVAQDAERYGYEPASLLRFRIFGKAKSLRLIRRPSYNTRLLGDAMGRLIGITGALNQNGSNIFRIAERLDQKDRDLFGLDGVLKRFDQLGQELLRTLNLIDAVIKGRPQRGPFEYNLPQTKVKSP